MLAPWKRSTRRRSTCRRGQDQRRFGERLNGKRFAIWGLAFKANTDDMREAPSRALIARSARRRARRCAPTTRRRATRRERALSATSPGVKIVDSAIAALEGADALAIVTEWQEFRSPDFAAHQGAALKTPAIFDGRNLYDPAVLKALGFEYFPIGRA